MGGNIDIETEVVLDAWGIRDSGECLVGRAVYGVNIAGGIKTGNYCQIRKGSSGVLGKAGYTIHAVQTGGSIILESKAPV